MARFRLWSVLLAAMALAIYFGLGVGESWINPFSPSSDLDHIVLWELRWPRVLVALAVGGLLALAGAWFQVLLGNPLAEPYVLGVAGSAACGAIASLALLPGSPMAMPIGAFAGAVVGISVIMAFAHLGASRLLLAGVVLAAFWSACLALMLALMPGHRLGMALSWMMGDLSTSFISIYGLSAVWCAALVAGLALSRSLDVLMLGEMHARAMGVEVGQLRMKVLLLASLVTAVAVTAAGTIGFVGLVVPHAMRLVFGGLHRVLLPASAVGGGTLLVLADAGSRVVIAPAELPVGVITAMIGVPVFLWLLLKRT